MQSEHELFYGRKPYSLKLVFLRLCLKTALSLHNRTLGYSAYMHHLKMAYITKQATPPQA